MGDFVSVLKLYSREICFQCKPNLLSEERRSTWSNSLLSCVKPYTNILFCIFPQKYFVFFIFFIISFSLQVKHMLPRRMIFEHFILKDCSQTSSHETRGDVLEENPSNHSYRFATYKQFIWFVFKRFGKETPVSFHPVWYRWLEKRGKGLTWKQ